MNDAMVKALETGRYESSESIALEKHLRMDDRVLELGAGAGYLTMQIAQRIGSESLLTVEANPKMLSVIENNLVENDITGVTVVNAAVVSDSTNSEYITFHITAAFWASSLDTALTKKWKSTKSVDVPAVKFSELLQEHQPTVIMMDIEGGEADLFDAIWPDHIRLLIIELHPRVYDDTIIKKIFDQMSNSGLTYCPNGSRGDVVVFKRVTND